MTNKWAGPIAILIFLAVVAWAVYTYAAEYKNLHVTCSKSVAMDNGGVCINEEVIVLDRTP